MVLVLALAGCDRPAPPAQPPANAAGSPGPTIAAVKPEKRAVRRVVEQPGAVQPFEETELFARLPGYVKAVAPDPAKKDRPPHDRATDIGSRVKAGQVLAELAVPEVEEEAKQKEAFVRQAAAEVEQAKKAVAAAEAAVGAAQAQVTEARAGMARADALYARWQKEASRVGELVRGGVIDAQTRDETQNQLLAAEATRAEAAAKVTSAEAAVRKAQADRDKTTADVTAAEARLDVARADARRQAALLAYAQLRAPFDGVVTRRAADTGDFLQPGGTRVVFTVARADPVRVVVAVPEADAGLVREGTPARVSIPALGGPELTGSVTRTAWSLDPGARTLRTEIDLPNPDGRLRPGMYV